MNKVFLIGRLVKDADYRVSANEKQTRIAKFTLAVPRKFKKDECDYIDCSAFNNVADIIEKYTNKGTKISVGGSINKSSFTDKDGNTRYYTSVMVDDVELLGSRTTSNEESANANKNETTNDGFENMPDSQLDLLPF